jgi:hypothetical protein
MQYFRGGAFPKMEFTRPRAQLLLVRRYESEVLRGTSVRNVHDEEPSS